MSDTADPELCSLIISAKTTSKFRLASPLGLFCLNSFHGFVFRWEDRIIVCLVLYFVIKMWENPYKKQQQTRQTAVKTFKKHQNISTEAHKKRQMLFYKF